MRVLATPRPDQPLPAARIRSANRNGCGDTCITLRSAKRRSEESSADRRLKANSIAYREPIAVAKSRGPSDTEVRVPSRFVKVLQPSYAFLRLPTTPLALRRSCEARASKDGPESANRRLLDHPFASLWAGSSRPVAFGNGRLSDCVQSQAISFRHGCLSRRMALRMVRSLRAAAMATSILGLPASMRRWRKALRIGL
jgi:hypothetical protein